MRNPKSNMVEMLNSVLGVPVWSGVTPEDENRPSVSFVQLPESYSRNLAGSKTKKKSTFKLNIECNNTDEMEDILNDLEDLDNSITSDYGHIYTNLDFIEEKGEYDMYQRAFVQLEIY